jgi:hypothetical protein
MNPITFSAFTDELQKIALPRAVQEWRKATAAGQGGAAGQIAQSYGSGQASASPNVPQRLQQYKARKAQLGLAGRAPSAAVRGSAKGRSVLGVKAPAIAAAGPAPRYLKDVSIGGQEAAVDLMMGGGASPAKGETFVRKMYKHDSPITQGSHTTQLLTQKQRVTDTARALSPEAKAMVPAMYGHKTLGSGANLRHTSAHEFIPGLTEAGNRQKMRMEAGKTVLDPMATKGVSLRDVRKNPGNLVSSPQGTKIVDFLPMEHGKSNPLADFGSTPEGKRARSLGEFSGTQYTEPKQVQQVRKDVFKSQGGSRQPKKVRIGPAGTPRVKPPTSAVAKLAPKGGKIVKTLGKLVRAVA